jgi:signal transduction histidine kinase
VQDKMASLGHVAAGIAHEIRNPLSGINIYRRVLKKHYNNPEKTEKIEKTLDEIKLASTKIENVIRRVMDFTKPYEPRFSEMNINQPIKDALRLAETTQRRNGIMTSSDLDDNLPLCMGEQQLIEEVILNLINNSADAMTGQIDLKKIHISTQSDKNRLIVTIEDSGPGIPKDARERIFEPFFTTKKQSTGIGLSICHRIITDHGGTLEVASNEGQGAKFLLKLPINKRTEESAERG